MISRQQYLVSLERMAAASESLFALVPADKLAWAPREGMLTCGQQMIHAAGALAEYANGIAAGKWMFGSLQEILTKNHETPSVSAAVATRVMRRSFQTLRTVLESLSEKDLESEVFAPQFGREIPRWQLIVLCMEHHLNHKAELFLYLRLLGIPVGTKELYFGNAS
ncbi:MAG: DinB family protein [Bacteroidetes bacterium]|jgi:uncharacterized damage-inducible protein DinB|nr:DinB family protein [Bacteroidota bacterium]